MKRENESTKVFCQHPWGQCRALRELTWAAAFQPFSPCSSPLCYASFCHSLPSIWQIPLPPLPPVPSKWPLFRRARACSRTHTAHPSGCILLTGGLLCYRPVGPLSFSSSCASFPRCWHYNEVKSRFCPPRFTTTWSEHLQRQQERRCSILTAPVSQEGEDARLRRTPKPPSAG